MDEIYLLLLWLSSSIPISKKEKERKAFVHIIKFWDCHPKVTCGGKTLGNSSGKYCWHCLLRRISNSQVGNDGEVQLLKNYLHVALWQISSFFGSPTPYKKHEECSKTFLQDLVLLIPKGFLLLNNCKNLWMQHLALQLDPKVVFPSWKMMNEEIFPMMVESVWRNMWHYSLMPHQLQ